MLYGVGKAGQRVPLPHCLRYYIHHTHFDSGRPHDKDEVFIIKKIYN